MIISIELFSDIIIIMGWFSLIHYYLKLLQLPMGILEKSVEHKHCPAAVSAHFLHCRCSRTRNGLKGCGPSNVSILSIRSNSIKLPKPIKCGAQAV